MVKKKLLLALITSIMLVNISCENFEVDCKEVLFIGDNLVGLNGKKFTGNCFVVKDSIIVETRSYKDGKRSGEWVHYFDNGRINFKGIYSDNELDGPYISFHKNGKKKAEGRFNKGFYSGPWNFYDEKGELIEQKIYKIKEK